MKPKNGREWGGICAKCARSSFIVKAGSVAGVRRCWRAVLIILQIPWPLLERIHDQCPGGLEIMSRAKKPMQTGPRKGARRNKHETHPDGPAGKNDKGIP